MFHFLVPLAVLRVITTSDPEEHRKGPLETIALSRTELDLTPDLQFDPVL
ncbi:MAG: hypothetical protein IPH53_16430 [Flavobacteriales bacterium]|nr:hypothetical protein [Flavobacteriales bacterium]